MHFKALRWLFLFAVVIVQVGCAAEEATAGQPAESGGLEPVPSHDDSHGWSGNFSAGSH